MMLNRTKLGMAVVTALLLATGCEQKHTAGEHLATAKSYLSAKDDNKAVIELKNALSKDQSLDEARLLLGQLYLQSGEFLAAEIEFNKLYNSEYPSPQLTVDLAKARYLQQEFDTIADLWQAKSDLSSAQTAQLGFYTYIALKRAENIQQLEHIKRALIPAKQEQTYTKLIMAYEQAEQQQVEQALTTVNNVLLAEPNNIDALLFKGQLHSFKKEYEEAATAFESFLKVMPNYLLTELYLADVLFNNKQFDKAEPYIEKLAKAAPDFGYINYLKGMLLFTKNQFEESKLHLEKAIQAKANVQQSKLYAGLSAYRTENYEQAYEYLTGVIDLVPNNDELRKLLGVVQFKLGYNIEASDSIARLTQLSEQDLNLANNASFSFIKSGELDKAKKVIEQASKIDTDNALELAKLGMLKVTLEDMSGIVDIKKSIELDSSIEQAKVALVQAYLGQGASDDALDVADQWIKDEPDNVDGYNLAGFVAAKKGDLALAKEYLLKALELDKGNILSLMFLAGEASKNEDIEKATELLTQLINNKPDYVPALVNNYLLSKRLNKVDGALSLLSLAVEKSPNNSMLQQVYLRALFTEGKIEEAIDFATAQELSADTPEIFWVILVNIYIDRGDFPQVRKYANLWTEHQPSSERAWATAIQTADHGQPLEVIKLFKRAIRIFPDSPELRVMLVEQHLKANQLTQAKIELQKVKVETDKSRYLNLVIALNERKYEEVEGALEGMPLETENHAVMYVKALKGTERLVKANQVVNEYLEVYPNSSPLLFEKATLKQFYSEREQKDLYDKILSINADNVFALNNLANIHLRANTLDKGLELATKAFKLAPNFLPVVDTYATALTANEQHQQAAIIYKALFKETKDNDYFEKMATSMLATNQKPALRQLMDKYKADLSQEVRARVALKANSI